MLLEQQCAGGLLFKELLSVSVEEDSPRQTLASCFRKEKCRRNVWEQ